MIFKLFRDIFQIIIVIPVSLVVGIAMLIHALLDDTWQNLAKQIKVEKPRGYRMLKIPYYLLGILVVPARFILKHLFKFWQKLVEKAFTLGV